MNMSMTSQACLPLVLLAATASACGGPLKTGTTIRPSDALPEEGPCPSDTTVCGTGPLVVCANLQNDPEHCGSCERACAPGVTCTAGVCQRILCHGQPLLSGTPITSTSLLDPNSSFFGAVLADANGDGQLDLVTWQTEIVGPSRTKGSSSFSIWLGQSGGRFASPQNYAANGMIRRVQVADVNHDGVDDLLLLKLNQPCLELWLGHSDGPPTPGPEIPALDCSWAMAIADISGDGNVDVVATSPPDDALSVYLSDGATSFQSPRSYAAGLRTIYDAVVRDWNGDGFPDLVVMGSSLQILTNRGDGTFDDAVDCGLAMSSASVVSDFNHDGHMDIATPRSYGAQVDVLLGQGECRFAPAAVYAISEDSESCGPLKTADMDGDGQLDLLCMSMDNVFTLLGNPDGSFQAAAPVRLVGAAGRDTLLIGDVTGDGRLDVVVADRQGSVGAWENTCR
jgi:hypothetical protein